MVPEVKNVFSSATQVTQRISLNILQECFGWNVLADNCKSKTDFQQQKDDLLSQHEAVQCLMIICFFHHFLFRSEAREDPYTDYYIWKDANSSNPGGLPNNWWGMSAVQSIENT